MCWVCDGVSPGACSQKVSRLHVDGAARVHGELSVVSSRCGESAEFGREFWRERGLQGRG